MDFNEQNLPYKILPGIDPRIEEHFTPEIDSILISVLAAWANGQPVIDLLNNLRIKYPQIIFFKELLVFAHYFNQDVKGMKSAVQRLHDEHPEFFQGRFGLAHIAIIEKRFDDALEYLGKDLDLGALYPNQKGFYINDVMSFNHVVFEYFWRSGRKKEALARFNLLKSLGEHHPTTNSALKVISSSFAISFQAPDDLKTSTPPSFHFPKEIGWLYEFGLDIEHKKIEKILMLDQIKLIQDLESVLLDSINRYDYFFAKSLTHHDDNFREIVNHSLLLLTELRSHKSLETILQVMLQDLEYEHFWCSNLTYDTMLAAVYHCGRNRIDVIFDILKTPNISGYNTCLISGPLNKIIEDSLEDRDIFVKKFKDLLEVFIENSDSENPEDIEAVSFIICEICNLGYHELLPEIKQLHEMNLTNLMICSPYQEIENDIREAKRLPPMPFLNMTIYQRYEEDY